MRRRMMPNLLGDYAQLEQRQAILERILQMIGFSPENPYTLFVNDGTYNRVEIGVVNGDYGIRIRDNAGNLILLANGTIVADAIKAGTLDCSLITVENLDAGSITVGTLSASRISGGILNCSLMTVQNLNAGSITVGTFPSPNSRFVDNSLSGVKITGGTLHGNKIIADTITADQIAAGTITADEIHAKTITADRIVDYSLGTSQMIFRGINVDRVSADRLSSLVSLTGVIYCGGSGNGDGRFYARNAGGSVYLDIDNDGIWSSANIIVDGGAFAAVGSGRISLFMTSNYAIIDPPDQDQRLIFHGRTIQWNDSGGTNMLDFNKGSSRIYDDGQLRVVTDDHLYLQAGSAIRPNCHIIFEGERNVENVDWIRGSNDLQLWVTGGNRIFFDASEDGNDLSMYPKWGDFYATGNKSFRIKHPDHPDEGWIQYTSIESPEVALKIRGVAKLNNGEATITLPRHWVLVTEDILTTLQLTPLEDCMGLFAPKSSLTNESFKVKELQGGTSNAEFAWELTCTRKGYAGFNPEQTVEAEVEKHARALVDGLVEHETKNEHFARREAKAQERIDFRNAVLKRYKEITGKVYVDKAKVWREEELAAKSAGFQKARDNKPVITDEELDAVKAEAIIAHGNKLQHHDEIDALVKKHKDFNRAIKEISGEEVN